MSYEVFERFIYKVRESKVITRGNFKLVAKNDIDINIYYNDTLIRIITHGDKGQVFPNFHNDYKRYKNYTTLDEMLKSILAKYNEIIEIQAAKNKELEEEYINFMNE